MFKKFNILTVVILFLCAPVGADPCGVIDKDYNKELCLAREANILIKNNILKKNFAGAFDDIIIKPKDGALGKIYEAYIRYMSCKKVISDTVNDADEKEKYTNILNAEADYAFSKITGNKVHAFSRQHNLGNYNRNYIYTGYRDYEEDNANDEIRIKYGYNSMGDFVPTSIGDERIKYGYNAMGDFVPTSIGNKRIKYGYNAYGDFVPMGFKNENSPF